MVVRWLFKCDKWNGKEAWKSKTIPKSYFLLSRIIPTTAQKKTYTNKLKSWKGNQAGVQNTRQEMRKAISVPFTIRYPLVKLRAIKQWVIIVKDETFLNKNMSQTGRNTRRVISREQKHNKTIKEVARRKREGLEKNMVLSLSVVCQVAYFQRAPPTL